MAEQDGDVTAVEDKMIRGEVPLDDPDNVDWPDQIPVQSRYGKPGDHLAAQSTAAQQAPVDIDRPAPVDVEPKTPPAPEPAPPAPAPALPLPPQEK